MKTIVLIALLCFVAGCVEPFTAGVASGATAAKMLADSSQKSFIESMNKLNAEKAEVDKLIDEIEDSEVKEALKALVDKQTIEELEKLGKTNWKDPKVSGGYALALVSLLAAAYQKKKRIDGK